MSDKKLQDLYIEVINHFGGQQQTADALDVKQPSVNSWKQGKAKMKPRIAAKVQTLSNGKFRAKDLCPELKEVLQILNVA